MNIKGESFPFDHDAFGIAMDNTRNPYLRLAAACKVVISKCVTVNSNSIEVKYWMEHNSRGERLSVQVSGFSLIDMQSNILNEFIWADEPTLTLPVENLDIRLYDEEGGGTFPLSRAKCRKEILADNDDPYAEYFAEKFGEHLYLSYSPNTHIPNVTT